MVEKITKLIACILTFNCVIASASLAPLSINIANDEQANISLSSEDMNRLFVNNDKIISVNAPNSRLIAQNDQSGSIYINVTGVTPFTAFVTTESGRHFSILVMPKRVPGVTVRFMPTTPSATHYITHSAAGQKLEDSTPYENTLVALLKDAMLQQVPPGYSSIAPSAFSSIPVFAIPPYLDAKKTLAEKVVSGSLGGELGLRVIELDNKSRHNITLVASNFYMPGVRAVAIDSEYVPGHKSTYIYEVISNV